MTLSRIVLLHIIDLLLDDSAEYQRELLCSRVCTFKKCSADNFYFSFIQLLMEPMVKCAKHFSQGISLAGLVFFLQVSRSSSNCQGGSVGNRNSAARPFYWCTNSGDTKCRVVISNFYFDMAGCLSSTYLVYALLSTYQQED